ncbi:MAG: helix-turn-helix transcriptional regulator [Acidimicrobiales bacterium]
MAQRYADYSEKRRSMLSDAGAAASGAFEQAATMAAQIVGARVAHKLTQAELAAKAGISQGDLSRIERGSTRATEPTLQKIAAALGCELRLVKTEHS